ncbi:NAD(P)(+) transhydrogenase (Re/Si-specific) subunit beta [Streptomyces sp. MB22_4]|uniref:NAD(P)(+) transhydrogenase (Re/Si-specific) subunit beta n=1 Tax=Streptomyces sp. MB22_4 TaxID=3383120 RepID=UPI0039A14F81
MNTFDTATWFAYLACAVCFVIGLHLMNAPHTARRGNLLSAGAMAVAVCTAVARAARAGGTGTGVWILLAAGIAAGSAAGVVLARRVRMTAMPQLVSLFNAVGGGAALLISLTQALTIRGTGLPGRVSAPLVLGLAIGSVTLSGSLVAAGKLQGLVSGAPVRVPGRRALGAVSLLAALGTAVWFVADPGDDVSVFVLLVVALAYGLLLALPIGGADMPVVISLLNAFTGLAVAMAGLVVDDLVLIIAGALVGAAGSILTGLMAKAMNRSVGAIVAGGFGTSGGAGPSGPAAGRPVHVTEADDAAVQLAYAHKVVIVPGYGLAVAHAEHEVAALARFLGERGIDVAFAIHPVAGRMPGHMNVLLAEANVPYEQFIDMDQANSRFAQTDVALVVGANDVTNPAARRPGTAISGMPILDVDAAKSVVVIKRSLGHGYAGIDNDLFTNPRTSMFFTDAKAGLTALLGSVRTLVG